MHSSTSLNVPLSVSTFPFHSSTFLIFSLAFLGFFLASGWVFPSSALRILGWAWTIVSRGGFPAEQADSPSPHPSAKAKATKRALVLERKNWTFSLLSLSRISSDGSEFSGSRKYIHNLVKDEYITLLLYFVNIKSSWQTPPIVPPTTNRLRMDTAKTHQPSQFVVHS